MKSSQSAIGKVVLDPLFYKRHKFPLTFSRTPYRQIRNTLNYYRIQRTDRMQFALAALCKYDPWGGLLQCDAAFLAMLTALASPIEPEFQARPIVPKF